MDNLIYNQMVFENLLKDYKWNNPELKNIINNTSFQFIEDFNSD